MAYKWLDVPKTQARALESAPHHEKPELSDAVSYDHDSYSMVAWVCAFVLTALSRVPLHSEAFSCC